MTVDYYFQIAALNELIYKVLEYFTKSLKQDFSENFTKVPVDWMTLLVLSSESLLIPNTIEVFYNHENSV